MNAQSNTTCLCVVYFLQAASFFSSHHHMTTVISATAAGKLCLLLLLSVAAGVVKKLLAALRSPVFVWCCLAGPHGSRVDEIAWYLIHASTLGLMMMIGQRLFILNCFYIISYQLAWRRTEHSNDFSIMDFYDAIKSQSVTCACAHLLINNQE